MEKQDKYFGRTIGGCLIGGKLGQGANGSVYRAEQLSLRRQVAVKMLNEDKSSDPDFTERFFREARVGAKLSSEYIVKIFDLGVTAENICFFVMELVDGENAEQYLFRQKRLPERTVLDIARAVAAGLYYAYEKCRFIHGDLKPANVLIRHRDGAIKLADLGTSQREDDKNFPELMATPAYTPPELAVGEFEKFGLKTDLYSYGVMLFELLTGHVPYRGENPDEVLRQHLLSPIPDITRELPCINPLWQDLLQKLLAKSQSARPDSWGEVLCALAAIHL